MKKYVNRVCYALCLVLLVGIYLSMRWGLDQRAERLRLGANQQALLTENTRYRVRDSLNAVSSLVVELRTEELKAHFSELTSLVKDMNLRLNRIEGVSQNAVQSEYTISTPARDTLLPVTDTNGHDTAIAIDYRSPHIVFSGMVHNSVFTGDIITYDTLTQIVHRVPRRFLFFRWGTKELRQDIVSSNPHTKITYSRYIRVSRK